jgi:hypothetical protein
MHGCFINRASDCATSTTDSQGVYDAQACLDGNSPSGFLSERYGPLITSKSKCQCSNPTATQATPACIARSAYGTGWCSRRQVSILRGRPESCNAPSLSQRTRCATDFLLKFRRGGMRRLLRNWRRRIQRLYAANATAVEALDFLSPFSILTYGAMALVLQLKLLVMPNCSSFHSLASSSWTS